MTNQERALVYRLEHLGRYRLDVPLYMLSGRLADTAGAVPHGYVCPGVGDVVHGDAGSVTLHLEVVDRGDVGKAENES